MKTISRIFDLSTWGKVCAFADVSINPYFDPSDREEPRYIIEGVEVYRGEEGNIYRGLSRQELAQVEEELVSAFELCQEAASAVLSDSRVDSHRLEYA